MPCMKSNPVILPFFPLNVFLFPGEDIPLRIFEPRYKQLVEDARKTGITFAIPFVLSHEIQEYGCEVRLKEIVAENPGGRMVISVESLYIVRIINFSRQLEGKLYAGGSVSRLPDSDFIESENLIRQIHEYRSCFDPDFLNTCNHSRLITHHDVLRALNLSSDEKFQFILMSEKNRKEDYLSGQLRYLEMIRKQESLLGDDFGLN
ncbi:MAG: hypothetical protein EHM46_01225 [Bacteroidetes bacterium]|nr:MAG: hypothetical protein EHM46_01225 [Bacteroidota bacterium]